MPRPPIVAYTLALCFEHGLGVTASSLKAETLYAEAAAQGHSPSQYNYAVFLERGLVGFARLWHRELGDDADRGDAIVQLMA